MSTLCEGQLMHATTEAIKVARGDVIGAFRLGIRVKLKQHPLGADPTTTCDIINSDNADEQLSSGRIFGWTRCKNCQSSTIYKAILPENTVSRPTENTPSLQKEKRSTLFQNGNQEKKC
ncbi:hypothetical protein CBL_12371 [Carabus blaptoides fortunei]